MYIGKTPTVGNFQVCDAISVVNGQAAYTLQVGGVNVAPESANHMLVSLNGILQKPGSSFTISGSTMTFASNLATGDVIDFVQILGNVLDIGQPSDATITSAKLSGALVTPSTLDVNGNELILDADADTSITADTDDQIDFKIAGSDKVTIKSDGNVGIGTTSPNGGLEVTDADSETYIFITNTKSGGSGQAILVMRNDAANFQVKCDVDDTFKIRDAQNSTDRIAIDQSGNIMFGKTSTSDTVTGLQTTTNGGLINIYNTNGYSVQNRQADDGTFIYFKQANSTEGSISVSGTTVSYNGFTGTHWTRLADNSKPTILRGTVLETLDEMVDWYNLEFDDSNGNAQKIPHLLTGSQSAGDKITYDHNGTDYEATIVREADIKHMKSKVSDTTDAKNVYGVFSHWDFGDDDGINDMIVASVGSFVVRIKSGETVAKGDLLQSNGDGTAKVQSDDNIKASSFAKVLSTTKIETYDDGSFIVPCSLMC